MARKGTQDSSQTASLGFEAKLWEVADLLRNNMDPGEYKHVVLGLLFLKYIDDAFAERGEQLQEAVADPKSSYYIANAKEREQELKALLEDRDEYTAENILWLPPNARWSYIRNMAPQPNIGRIIDDAMYAIEKENPIFTVLPKVYALPNLTRENLRDLINFVNRINLGTLEHQRKDTLGRVYEYFLSRFAGAEGKAGGDFYTPKSVVRLLVEILEPYKGRIYDPCCGSGGMFAQALEFILAHNGRRDQVTIYGQESNYTTWRMAQMNLAIRGIEASLGKKHADSFHEDLHLDLQADYILANPPFNTSDWGSERLENDVRWKYGRPPASNANFAWIQHILHHLAPSGTAGVVLANGSMSSLQSGEGEIRRSIIEADLVDCMVALPGQLFYSTQISACLWFLTKSKSTLGHRPRKGQTLFIDARRLGQMESRVHRALTAEDIQRVADTFHAWRNKDGRYKDIPGFCKSSTLEEIQARDFVLAPGLYVGAEETEDSREPFEDRMERLVTDLRDQLARSERLEVQIKSALKGLGYEI
ncbi:SAM-dependent DNA methyltransferase [Corallococcus sp. CA054B]|uniref:class I SAM-dependent DNA methyltransferase n=1 Tax=Corallococcus sp. CA054B TaxID=2316734 RepID=UPI000EA3D885|nr:class I SAM-dependent DNA methyltransferase [Corallococcus sp. CA054B]RKG68589.1 SAM-dependent DNA methyltransferase [Corallococcus sp. CA054B]